MSKPMTPRDLIDLGYSPEWAALSIRIATQMQMKARQQARERLEMQLPKWIQAHTPEARKYLERVK